jgi:methylmalonyl-CoA/ethylmalonyl-CoA epimerase
LWEENGGKGQMFNAGRGTLEVFDPIYAEVVDQLEVGQRVSGKIRFAFEVPDVHEAVKKAIAYGAELVHEPTITPWGDLNARVQAPDGLHLTLFQTSS